MSKPYIYRAQSVKANINTYQRWLESQKTREAQREEFFKHSECLQKDLDELSDKAKSIISAVNKMDKYSEERSKDASFMSNLLVMGLAGGLFQLSRKISLPIPEKYKLIAETAKIILPQLFITVPLAYKIFAFPKKAAKIARFQARKRLDNNDRRFIQYTPAQVEQAKKLIQQAPPGTFDPPKNKFINPFKEINSVIKHCVGLLKNEKHYNAWEADFSIKNNKIKDLGYRNFTEDEILKARQEQRLILHVISKAQQKAADYRENIGTFRDPIEIGLGLAAGKMGALIANHPKIKSSSSVIIPIASLVGALSANIALNKAEKCASKAGRFVAQEEMLNNPSELFYVPSEKLPPLKKPLQSEPKNYPFKNIIDAAKMIPTIYKDYEKYRNYTKGKGLEEHILHHALKEIPITLEQEKKALMLQNKVFRAFEIVDNQTSKYTKDVESTASMVNSFAETVLEPILEMATITAWHQPARLFKPLLAFPIMIALGKEPWDNSVDENCRKVALMKGMEKLQDPINFVDYTETDLNTAPAEKAVFLNKLLATYQGKKLLP